ncbi:B12-binding domain-containing radical SAM protein [Clostridium tyrobutyricum]|uniref:B12-binding domain-containing radical SAM protein n=1 Tax=Clostridium tyrobutyricum TaxID=1519 RepID=UPI001C38AAA1|nr:B12-binding domain-containing radical SAM protein [Clostridium tyrobutyricum]MBV4418127.1 B12-binding domain-containing radical SAM protein [Clostridium tyrobutyricum]
MKIVLTAINAKFIHSNLAVRYLKSFTREIDYTCVIKEFSINDRRENMLEEIIKEKPDMVGFSCYIWNIDYCTSLAELIKLIDPNIKIFYGGPEVSYDCSQFLKYNQGDYVISGEGEATYYDLLNFEIQNSKGAGYLGKLEDIKGLCFNKNGKVVFNGKRKALDLNEIIFPYGQNDNLDNKIVYYEASRGCPFSCKYCLSSTTEGVRFLNAERVKSELNFLINKGIKLIKFVDRTFNCNYKFAIDIWKFIIAQDTDATFHFEISADILTDEEIEVLNSAPKGRIQLEVGVQTTNWEVLKNINRRVKFSDIENKVERIQKYHNINQHLDLIVGLPGEDFASFKSSFNDVYSIHPEKIQVGFLKLLKGSSMRYEAEKWGIVYSPFPPYEILKNDFISYMEILSLKRVDEVVDKYYNSGKFNNILKYFLNIFSTPFDFYYELGKFFYDKGYLNRNISAVQYYKVFLEFNSEHLEQDNTELKEIIKYDYLEFNKKRWLPEFLVRDRIKEEERILKNRIKDGDISVSGNYHIEKFFIDVHKFQNNGILEKKEGYIIFDGNSNREIYLFD